MKPLRGDDVVGAAVEVLTSPVVALVVRASACRTAIWTSRRLTPAVMPTVPATGTPWSGSPSARATRVTGQPTRWIISLGGAGGDACRRASLPEPGPVRPRKRPEELITDKGYAHDSIRRASRQRGVRHVIPERSDQVARQAAKGSAGGRPPVFDKAIYQKRNVVERCFNRFKQWRDLATRHEKRASLYRASLVLIAAVIWLP